MPSVMEEIGLLFCVHCRKMANVDQAPKGCGCRVVACPMCGGEMHKCELCSEKGVVKEADASAYLSYVREVLHGHLPQGSVHHPAQRVSRER